MTENAASVKPCDVCIIMWSHNWDDVRFGRTSCVGDRLGFFLQRITPSNFGAFERGLKLCWVSNVASTIIEKGSSNDLNMKVGMYLVFISNPFTMIFRLAPSEPLRFRSWMIALRKGWVLRNRLCGMGSGMYRNACRDDGASISCTHANMAVQTISPCESGREETG